MTKQQARRIFFDWLKKWNVYEQYKHYRHINNTHKCSLLYRSPMLWPTVYIVDAFMWDRTTQGFDFWSALNEQWIRYFLSLDKDPRYN